LQQAIQSAMKIDKDILERYHKNQCTAEESDMVEAWLFSNDSGEVLDLPPSESKDIHKLEIWNDIATVLPHSEQPGQFESISALNPQPLKRKVKMAFWSGAIAASLVTAIFSTVIFQLMKTDLPETALVNIKNTSADEVRHLTSGDYTIAVGTNTSARIDNVTGVVDLNGSMLICPKKDVELSFRGSTRKITFIKGQTYILLKGKDGKDKILIVDKKNLMDLPPVLQKQITHEFNI